MSDPIVDPNCVLTKGITGQGKNPTLQRAAEKYSDDDRYQLWAVDGKSAS